MAKKIEYSPDILEIARLTKALSHPVRVYILKQLAEMNACCYSGNLIDELPIGRSALSQHLKELKYAGLIMGEIESPYIKYCLDRENWEKASEIIKSLFDNKISIK